MLYIYQLQGLSAAEQNGLLAAADRCGEAVCLLNEADLRTTVAELLNAGTPMDMRAFKPLAQEEAAPFLLMDLDDLALDPFLAELRKQKVRIDHKCMVTEKNRSWPLSRLIGDVAEEHAMMSALMTLQQMLAAADNFKEEEYDPLLWMSFERRRQQAADLLAHVGKAPLNQQMIEATTKDLNQSVMAMIVARGGRS